MTDISLGIHDLTLGSVAPALEVHIKLDQLSEDEICTQSSLPLLKFLRQHHHDLLAEICCVDFTMYEYGLEGVPFFNLIAPRSTRDSYKSAVRELTTPETTSIGERSYSVALNPDFRKESALKIITLPPVSEEVDSKFAEFDAKLVGESYHLSTPTGYFEYPKLEDSLRRFGQILILHRRAIRSAEGKAICSLVCCNFTLPELEESGPLRSLGQLFLGLSESPFQESSSLRPAVARLVSDLGFLLYRGGSASLLLAAGRDSSRATFAHEAKQLVKLVRGWRVPLDYYFDVIDEQGSIIAQLKEENSGLSASDFSLILFPEYFSDATNQILAWTMADSVSDLPFYSSGNTNLPSTFRGLFIACHETSIRQCILSFLRASGSVHLALLGMRRLDTYLRKKMPSLEVTGSAIDCSIDWESAEFRPRLVDFSRLMMVIFREAIQHGSWSGNITVSLEMLDDVLDMKATNGLWDRDVANTFDDAPVDLPLRRTSLENTREYLHAKTPTFSWVGRQGRRQIAFLAGAAGGNLIYSGESGSPRTDWMVHCRFGRAAEAQR